MEIVKLLTKKTRGQYTWERLEKVVTSYPKIPVNAGRYMGNGRCHYNAVNEAVLDKTGNTGVAMVFAHIPNSGINLHFVNFKKIGGKRSKTYEYTDNTSGYLALKNNHYLIKHLTQEECDRVYWTARSYADNLMKDYFNWFELRYMVSKLFS